LPSPNYHNLQKLKQKDEYGSLYNGVTVPFALVGCGKPGDCDGGGYANFLQTI